MEVDLGVPEVDHFADHVVRKFVVQKLLQVPNHFLHDRHLLALAPSLQARLHHAAALLVFGDLPSVLNDGCINRLFVFIPSEDFEASLHHMVAVNVNRKF